MINISMTVDAEHHGQNEEVVEFRALADEVIIFMPRAWWDQLGAPQRVVVQVPLDPKHFAPKVTGS